jgi:hypothetical protein
MNGDPEYQTAVIGAAPLVKAIISTQAQCRPGPTGCGPDYRPIPEASAGGTNYLWRPGPGYIVNRMSFQPQPLYQLGPWAQEHGIHRLFNLDPAWLDDDRLGAMLEALADQQVSIWGALTKGAVKKFQVPLDWLHADTTSIYPSASSEQALSALEARYGTLGQPAYHPPRLMLKVILYGFTVGIFSSRKLQRAC